MLERFCSAPDADDRVGDKMKTARARLVWLALSPLMKASNEPIMFSTVAKFDHQGEDWKSDAWSVAINGQAPPEIGCPQIMNVRFLAEAAPHEWLSVGRKFELYGGSGVVACGEVIA